jgi:hypothetical protein
MSIDKLIPKVPDPYIPKNDQAQHWPACFGHVNYLIDQVNEQIIPFITPGVAKKVYSALLTTDNGDPAFPITATVLENTLGGTISYVHTGVGIYECTISLTNGLPSNATLYFLGQTQSINLCGSADDSSFFIQTFDAAFNLADGQLQNTPLKIEVYP